MHKLYDLGYQTIKDPAILVQVAEKLDAIVMDVRFSPRSRDYRWNMATLASLLQASPLHPRYVHVAELGNVNYKGWNAPIQISHLPYGLKLISIALEAKPVILMCTCRDRSTCHRLVIVKAAVEQIPGLVSAPLSLADCQDILNPGSVFHAQLKLF